MNKLKEKIKRGEKVFGTHIQLNDNIMTELIASLGYDYLWIDTEHTSLTFEQVEHHLQAARLWGVAGLVRVPWNDPVRMKPILEMGPDGIIVPMVNSYEEALTAVRGCMYPPRGTRGYGPRHANMFGKTPLNEYLKDADDDIMRIIQIEHIDAVRDLKRIVTVDEVDAFIIGPMDLSASLGKMGQMDDPEVQGLFDEIIATVHAAGKPIGLSYGPAAKEQLVEWCNRGLDMISCANEADFIMMQGKIMLDNMKDAMFGK